jgi:uncharacterized membrane protein YfcA
MNVFFFAGIVFLACFIQAAVGFGLPMVAMPVLIELYGIRVAAPLMALIILQLQILMILRYRSAWNLRTVGRISAAAVLGIPIGVLLLSQIPEAITVTILGLILIIYALYSLFRLPVPHLNHAGWAYLFGFIGGMGGGAYNMAAPPMIIYGDTQRWPPQEFKGNLQGYFFIITSVTIITHSLNHNITAAVLRNALLAIPLVLLGAIAGFYLDRYLNAALFRKVVLVLLLLLGISLALTWLR